MLDAEKFLNDYHIPYWTEGKNCQEGWINIQCPFCDDTQNHGGFNLKKEYYHCWKCGHHFLDKIIIELLKCTKQKALEIIKLYQGFLPAYTERPESHPQKIDLNMFRPQLNDRQKEYLKNRGFDPDYLQKKYNLMDSGIIGSYNFRIIAPIYLNNQIVSFQGRAYIDKHIPKYMACKKTDEVICHQHIVYNHDNTKNRRAIIVEGITDVWKFGDGAVAIFGQSYTIQQINFIIKNYDEVFIMLDPDAQRTAEKMANELSIIKVHIVDIPSNFKDPGEIPIETAEKMKKNLYF